MTISVFGLGYVGTVTSVCLANLGFKIIGVDINQTKIDLLNEGKSPIIEEGLENILNKVVSDKAFQCTNDVKYAIENSKQSLICVGTPSGANGRLETKYIKKICVEIGQSLITKQEYHVVAIRSTILPGTTFDIVIPILERESGKKVGEDFGVCFIPEFLREGSAVYDFNNPPLTVIGEYDERCGDLVESLFANLDAKIIRTNIPVAAFVKYSFNTWHGLKVGFANEIGRICKSLGIDSHSVMDIFTQDKKLNISTAYLSPGFAFGGSCLPKDTRALIFKAKEEGVDTPILDSILPSNAEHIEFLYRNIVSQGIDRKIGIVGLSFKEGTDDLRESPVVELVEKLLDNGYDLRIYDQNVNLDNIMGENRQYIENHLKDISMMMVESAEELVSFSEIIVFTKKDVQHLKIIDLLQPDHITFDLIGIDELKEKVKHYHGICW